MTRPATLLAVTGTATEIGKTWVSCALLAALRARGLRVAARKPVQSFTPGDGPTDAALLAAATGENVDAVCPPHRCLPLAMAPPMAAEALGTDPFTAADLVAEITFPPDVAVGLVETVGGVRSPMTADADSAQLAVRLHADATILVADASLGTINAVRLSAGAVDPAVPVVVVLNRFDAADELHERNRRWLAERDEYTVVTGVGDLADYVETRFGPDHGHMSKRAPERND